MSEHIVAVFQTNEEASAAVAELETAGIPASAIRQYASNGSVQEEVEPATDTSTHKSGGFWSWLFGDESETMRSTHATDADAYDRRTAAGNVAVSVTVADDSKIHQAIAALEAHHPVDIDERADEIEGHETTGTVSSAAYSTAGDELSSGDVARGGFLPAGEPAGVGAGRVDTPHAIASPIPAASPIPPASTALPASGTPGVASGREEVIQLAEEQLEVGKRTVDRGTTRIRRYVVEKPVEESVTLRGEKVTVERRSPLGTAASPGGAMFEERIVEVRETSEEPVVSKTAHVVEEVVVGREATERTETVRDTLRREDVEVTKDGDGKR